MAITVTRKTATFDVVTDLPLLDEWKAAVQAEKLAAAAQARAPETRRLSDKPSEATVKAEASAEVLALEERLAASTYTFTAQALARTEFQLLLTRHRPGKDDEDGRAVGYDREALSADLIPKSITGVTRFDGTPVDFDPTTEWADLAASMSWRQYQDVCTTVLGLNMGAVSVPPLRAISRTPRT
jgi:hypothetical protein